MKKLFYEEDENDDIQKDEQDENIDIEIVNEKLKGDFDIDGFKKIFSLLIAQSFMLFIFMCSVYIKTGDKVDSKIKESIDFTPVKIYEYKMNKINLNDINEVDEEQMKATLEQQAFDLTNSYIGIGGDCFKLSMQFIKQLKGIENPEYIEIAEKYSITGDLIFYERSSTGTTHYAVKLNENIAYQPNIDGKAKIGKIHYDNFSKPIFYRVIEKRGME